MDFEKASRYWTDRDAAAPAPDARVVRAAVEEFVAAHNTCALATADRSGFVRCTPIEYTFWRGAFWMLSEGGLKFRGLAENPNVCLAIYDAYAGFGELGGLQVQGKASVVEPFGDEYVALLEHKQLPVERLRALESPLHLIKVVPVSADLLSSQIKDAIGTSRAHLEW